MNHEFVLLESRGRIGVISLNRPKVLNTINEKMIREVVEAAESFDRTPSIGCIVIRGSNKAFAAGTDVTEVHEKSFVDLYESDRFAIWDRIAAIQTPLIASVAGFALGGGCELAMMCDLIIAADTARFGQPEIKLGVIPGIGALSGWRARSENRKPWNFV